MVFASSKDLSFNPKFLDPVKELLTCMQETTVKGHGGRGPQLTATEKAVQTLCGLTNGVKRCLIRMLHKIGADKTIMDLNKAQGSELDEYLKANLPNVLLSSSLMLQLCELIRKYGRTGQGGAARIARASQRVVSFPTTGSAGAAMASGTRTTANRARRPWMRSARL